MFSDFLRHVAEEVLRPVFERLAHGLGSVIVTGLSLGKVRCDRPRRGSSWKAHRATYGWLGIYRRDHRSIVLSAGFTALIGLAPFILLAAWLFFRSR